MTSLLVLCTLTQTSLDTKGKKTLQVDPFNIEFTTF